MLGWLALVSRAWAEELWFDSIPPQPTVALWQDNRWKLLKPHGRYVECPHASGRLRFRLAHPGYVDTILEVDFDRRKPANPYRIPESTRERVVLPPRICQVQFATSPPGAETYLLLPGGEKEYLGRSGEVLTLNLARVLGGDPAGVFHVEVRSSEGINALLPIPTYALMGPGVVRWPPQGTFLIPQARSSSVPIMAGMAAALLGLGAFWRSRRRPHPPGEITQRLGVRMGNYRLLERVARGASASVYRARRWDGSSPCEVAIKVLHPQSELPTGQPEAPWQDEVQHLLRLNHPHIVGLLDWGQDLGRNYLVLEWVDGQDLRHTLSASPLGPQAAARLLGQILEALEHAHGCGVLHRDLKPENILISQNGMARLTDFGLAIERGQRTPSLSGTPGYLAPELLKGSPPSVRSDLYSLGVVAREMLSGGAGGRMLPDWQDWLGRLTHPDPEQRFATAGEAAAALPLRPPAQSEV